MPTGMPTTPPCSGKQLERKHCAAAVAAASMRSSFVAMRYVWLDLAAAALSPFWLFTAGFAPAPAAAGVHSTYT